MIQHLLPSIHRKTQSFTSLSSSAMFLAAAWISYPDFFLCSFSSSSDARENCKGFLGATFLIRTFGVYLVAFLDVRVDRLVGLIPWSSSSSVSFRSNSVSSESGVNPGNGVDDPVEFLDSPMPKGRSSRSESDSSSSY